MTFISSFPPKAGDQTLAQGPEAQSELDGTPDYGIMFFPISQGHLPWTPQA